MHERVVAISAALLLCLIGCREPFSEQSSTSPTDDVATTSRVLSHHPATRAENWSLDLHLTLPIAARIAPAPTVVLDYIETWNRIDNFDLVPRPYSPSAAEQSAILAEIAQMPRVIERYLYERVVGIYLVEELGGSAMAGTIYEAGEPIAGFLILDLAMLNQPANDWITAKEQTLFIPVDNFKLRFTIATPDDNQRYRAIAYILLHELGHIFHETESLLPRYSEPYPNFDSAPYFALSHGRYQLPAQAELSRQVDLRFYAKPSIPLSMAAALYRELERWPIVSLYGAIDPQEDFAESFATTIHSYLLGRPHRLEILHNGEPVYALEEPILSPRLRGKREVILAALEEYAVDHLME